VVGAQDAAAALQGVLIEVTGGLRLSQVAQVPGEVVSGGQGVGVVGA
jgi:hypothetical protein